MQGGLPRRCGIPSAHTQFLQSTVTLAATGPTPDSATHLTEQDREVGHGPVRSREGLRRLAPEGAWVSAGEHVGCGEETWAGAKRRGWSWNR